MQKREEGEDSFAWMLEHQRNSVIVTQSDAEQLVSRLPFAVPQFLAFDVLGSLAQHQAVLLRAQANPFVRLGVAVGLWRPRALQTLELLAAWQRSYRDARLPERTLLESWWLAADHAVNLWASSFSLPKDERLDRFLAAIPDLRIRVLIILLFLRGGVAAETMPVALVEERATRLMWVEFLEDRANRLIAGLEIAADHGCGMGRVARMVRASLERLRESMAIACAAWETEETLSALCQRLSNCLTEPISLSELLAIMADPVQAYDHYFDELTHGPDQVGVSFSAAERLVPRFLLPAA
jgi:hypothetical protein